MAVEVSVLLAFLVEVSEPTGNSVLARKDGSTKEVSQFH